MIKYEMSVWEFRGFRKEIDKLCEAHERIRKAYESLSKTYDEYLKKKV